MASIVLSAGGTGGHLFPAEALAAELLRRGHKVTIITDKRGHAFKSLGDSVAVHTVRAATLKPGLGNKLRAVIDMAKGIVEAFFVLLGTRPAVVVGFGGYPSVPGVFSAQALRIPTVIHEQNAVMGKANLFLSRRASGIAASFPGTRGLRTKQLKKTTVTGNPVRPAIVAVRDMPYQPPADAFRILITGGSQAATLFSDIIPAAMAQLPADMKPRLDVMHQAREADVARAEAAYAAAGIRAGVRTFFTDMPAQLAACHLFIGRSGASTVTELAVAGRPAIYVPLRHADMQQKYNAETVTNQGGGWLVMQEDFTPAALAALLVELIQNPQRLEKSAICAKNCGQPDGASRLADMVENTLQHEAS